MWKMPARTLRQSARLTSLRRRSSFDEPIRSQQHGLRNREAERLRGLEVDHQFELRRLLDWEISGPGTFEDLVHQARGLAPQSVKVRRIARQPAPFYIERIVEHGRHRLLRGDLENQ